MHKGIIIYVTYLKITPRCHLSSAHFLPRIQLVIVTVHRCVVPSFSLFFFLLPLFHYSQRVTCLFRNLCLSHCTTDLIFLFKYLWVCMYNIPSSYSHCKHDYTFMERSEHTVLWWWCCCCILLFETTTMMKQSSLMREKRERRVKRSSFLGANWKELKRLT